VSPDDYEANLRVMIGPARAGPGLGGEVILLYSQVDDRPYRPSLEEVARSERVPLVDSRARIARARSRLEVGLESRLDLLLLQADPWHTNGADARVRRRLAGRPGGGGPER
jgi:hypothetical protein